MRTLVIIMSILPVLPNLIISLILAGAAGWNIAESRHSDHPVKNKYQAGWFVAASLYFLIAAIGVFSKI